MLYWESVWSVIITPWQCSVPSELWRCWDWLSCTVWGVSQSQSLLSSYLTAFKVPQHALPRLSLPQAQSPGLSEVSAITEIPRVQGELSGKLWVKVQGGDLQQWDYYITGALGQEIQRLLHLSVWKVGLSPSSSVVLSSSLLTTSQPQCNFGYSPVLDGFEDM